MAQQLKNIPELIFSSGMNDKDKPEFLKEGQCVLAQNCLLGDEQIVKGPGTQQLFNIGTSKKCLGGIATDTEMYTVFNEPGDTLAFIYRYTGSGSPIVVSGANLTADTEVNFVDVGDAVYVLNGLDAIGKIVGSTYTQPAGFSGIQGKYGAYYNNRLYITGDPSNEFRLDISDANDPETFDSNNQIEIFPDSSTKNTGLSSVGGILVIGKQNSLVSFNGYTTDDFTVKSITEELPNYGVTSHRSMVNIGNDLLFMSFASDVPHIRSLKRTSFDKLNYGGIVSEDIEGTMKTVNKNALDKVAGGFDGRYAWWAVPTGTSNDNDTVLSYDTYKKGWTVHTGNFEAAVFFRSTITGNDRLYFGDSSGESKVFEINKNLSSRNSEAITFKYKSRYYRPQVSRKSKFKYLYLTTGSSTNTSINILASPDGFTEELQDSFSPDTGSAVFPMTFPFALSKTEDKRYRINLKTRPAYSYQLVFEETSVGTSSAFPLTFPISFGQDTRVTIKDFDLYYYERKLRDAK